MSASKQRPLWHDLPLRLRQQIEGVVGGPVVAAVNCPGGFSPGFASRLTIAGGMHAFAKAIDARAWPLHAATYRDEARNAAALTEAGFAHALPTPRFLGTCDDGSHVALAFECVDGHEPASPWQSGQLATVAAAVRRMAALLTPSPLPAPSDHPRLGGWAGLGSGQLGRLRAEIATGELDRLIALERRGLIAAQGMTLVHFDALPHNILLTRAGVMLVDWPHARLGAPIIDLLTVLASAAADRIDPEPVLHAQPEATAPGDIDAILAALSGFWLSGAVEESCPAPVAAAKLHLGRGALSWLLRRLDIPSRLGPASQLGATSTASWRRSY